MPLCGWWVFYSLPLSREGILCKGNKKLSINKDLPKFDGVSAVPPVHFFCPAPVRFPGHPMFGEKCWIKQPSALTQPTFSLHL